MDGTYDNLVLSFWVRPCVFCDNIINGVSGYTFFIWAIGFCSWCITDPEVSVVLNHESQVVFEQSTLLLPLPEAYVTTNFKSFEAVDRASKRRRYGLRYDKPSHLMNRAYTNGTALRCSWRRKRKLRTMIHGFFEIEGVQLERGEIKIGQEIRVIL